MKGVVRYLKANPGFGLFFPRSTSKKIKFEMQVDASWGNSEKRKSVYGFLVQMNGATVSFRTKMQATVAQSTCEAEYVGIAEATKEFRFVRNLLKFLRVPFTTPVVYNDNHAALKIGTELGSVRRCRHIEMKHFWIQDLVEKKELKLEYKPTSQLGADLMTKALGRVQFMNLRNQVVRKF